MAKRSSNDWNREYVVAKDEVSVIKEEPEIEFALETEELEFVNIQLLKHLKLNYYGKVTGNLYMFDGGGAIVSVDKRDADIMLEKMGANCTSCPSSIGRTPYFALVEG